MIFLKYASGILVEDEHRKYGFALQIKHWSSAVLSQLGMQDHTIHAQSTSSCYRPIYGSPLLELDCVQSD